MDVFTHALASLTLTRAAIPRARRAAWAVTIVAGTIASIDALSALSSPAAYIAWYHTYTDSLVASVAAAALPTIAYVLCTRKSSSLRVTPATLFAIALLAAWLHLAMEACQSDGVALFWPFRADRIRADWLASVDPWIIAILLAAILLPELLRLVSDEIGAKAKSPRGQLAAILGLAFVILYVGVRAELHSNVLAGTEARNYQNESPRRAAAFPEAASLFNWHAIVETDSAVHEFTVNAAPGTPFDPQNNITLFKPEDSPALDHARDSDAAKEFLSVARFPKATVEKTATGFEVQLRDLRYAAENKTSREIVAIIDTDANGQVTDDTLLWARDLSHR
jgi:membrane-bound metal-dependent hydrolase YbcI (DUF457 family)